MVKRKEVPKMVTFSDIYLIKAGDLVEFPAALYFEWEVTKNIKKHYRLGS